MSVADSPDTLNRPMNIQSHPSDYPQIMWDEQLEHHLRQLVRISVLEDLDRGHDWTSLLLIDADTPGRARLVSRQNGIVAGLNGVPLVLDEMNTQLSWDASLGDGEAVEPGTVLGEFTGLARDMLVAERPLLNLLGRLSGIATLTRQFVECLAGSSARVYDTRKTTPGWRRLEKYAVRCGGGMNHRIGLNAGILVKDNHLAIAGSEPDQLAQVVCMIREKLAAWADDHTDHDPLLVEVEVDNLEQLEQVLSAAAKPDIVLLDNMPNDQLQRAVQLRNHLARSCELEASGGITLDRIASVAATGVERISVGALTHSALTLDIGLDWVR